MTPETFEAIVERCATVRVLMDGIQRQIRPGYHNARPLELLAKAQHALDDILTLLKDA
jgi:hypothetical protein